MARANDVSFSSRVNKIDRQHRKMSRGYVRLVERDGMLIPVPDRRSRRTFPYTGLMVTIVAFLTFKGFLLAYLGPITYTGRIEKLAEGGIGEQIGAWVMASDPIATWIAAQFAFLF